MALIDTPMTLTIAAGETASDSATGFDDAECLGIFAPTLTAAIDVQTSPDASGTGWYAMRSGTGYVTLASGDHVTVVDIAFKRLRVVMQGAAGAETTIKVVKQTSRT